MKEIIDQIGFLAAVVLPFWNIPLIIKIVKRRSSKDISLSWALGVWICILFMFPSGVSSIDFTWKVFNIVNLGFFTMVVFVTLKYRKGQ